MKEIIARIVDDSQFSEYKAEYGETVLCGYARIGGFAVGIVANQKTHVQQVDHAGNKRMEFGGVIYTESAEKAARFIMDCNQNLVPLIFLHDVNGFMVGRDAEWSGIIRAGAKMVNAVSNSVVPKISVIIGGSFGAGHYAMCGKAYDPRFVFAWPTAKYAVMSGASAANTLVEIKIKQLERGGTKLSEEDRKKLYDEVKATYDEQMDPRYGAARLWIDKIIDPAETREAIITGAGGGGAESRGAEVQCGSVADVGGPLFAIRSSAFGYERSSCLAVSMNCRFDVVIPQRKPRDLRFAGCGRTACVTSRRSLGHSFGAQDDVLNQLIADSRLLIRILTLTAEQLNASH